MVALETIDSSRARVADSAESRQYGGPHGLFDAARENSLIAVLPPSGGSRAVGLVPITARADEKPRVAKTAVLTYAKGGFALGGAFMYIACYAIYMAKVSKTICLAYEVAVELEEREGNQSEKVEQLLRDEYGL